jgi:hypothetical protein
MENPVVASMIRVDFAKTLLELHINLDTKQGPRSWSIEISSDGETITFSALKRHRALSDFSYEVYRAEHAQNDTKPLGDLIGARVLQARLGVGRSGDDTASEIYYFMLRTVSSQFLFFNNGDEGAIAIGDLAPILQNSLFTFRWEEIDLTDN